MSGFERDSAASFLIGWLEGSFLIVSMIIPRWVFRSKVPKCKSQNMSLLDWDVVDGPSKLSKTCI
jgi:hypothetical protein